MSQAPLSLWVRARRRVLDRLGPLGRAIQARRARTGALARVSERGEEWDTRLAELRATDSYRAAYEEERPLITVRVATYNRAEPLCNRALASLRRQTYENWEALVIGDCCTDDTGDRVAALDDDRIRFENLPVRGPYPADPEQMWQVAGTLTAMRAFELARGSWIAQLDDDDEWDDDHLEVLLAEARRTRAELLYAQWRICDARTGRLVRANVGTWPPEWGRIAMQAALEHGHLRHFPPNPLAYLVDEPGDWHRVRRLLEAGVGFAFLERPVTTIWYTPKKEDQRAWLEGMIERYGLEDRPAR